MKSAAWIVLFLLSAALAVSVVIAASPESSKGQTAQPAAAGETKPQGSAKTDEQPVDNSSCYVCHANFEDEEMVSQHFKANVGCIKCHGESLAHRNDENNTTPPDKMYASDVIEASCVTCHDTHDAPAKKVLAQWKKKCSAKTDPGQLVCTDCHGEHRMAQRTVRWDKKTGKLLVEGQ